MMTAVAARLLAAALTLGLATIAPAATAAPPPRPKLIVAISVDQFAASLFERYRPGFTGGLARLAGGIVYANGYQSHAATETCPGHSTILTGDHPARTGIAANTWFDVATGSSVYCVAVRGTADPDARGPQNLRVDTLGDWLKRAEPGARSIAVSGKDRAAIMMGGHHADAVYWWIDGRGFGTSSFAGPATPAVLAPATAFNARLTADWRSRPPALWPAAGAACAALVRPETFGGVRLTGAVPPAGVAETETGADFLRRSDFQDQLRASPLIDAVTLDFAGQLVDADHLGRGPATDLLAISLSATDYVGHRYGNGGAEMCTQVAALDRALGVFLDKVDGLGVPYIVVLTADHGGVDAAERAAAAGLPAVRIDGAAIVKALNAHLRDALGLAYDPVVGDDPQQLVVNVGGDAALKARVIAATVPFMRARPEVAQVLTADEVVAAVPPPGTSPRDLTIAQRFHESYVPGRSGDVAVAYREYATLGAPRNPGDVVAGHGAAWDHDRRVPILFWWPNAPRMDRPEAVETVDIAPTLAAVAAIPAPPVDGRVLGAVAGGE